MRGMSLEEYSDLHKRICDTARALSMRKNNDYAAAESNKEDPLRVYRNFMQCEHQGICSVEQGFLVRLSDKFSRLSNLLRPGHERAVEDENIEDTILDIVNYSILLQGYRVAKGTTDGQKET